MKNHLQNKPITKRLLLSFFALFAAIQGATAQELDLSQARQMGQTTTGGSSGARRDKGMPLSFEMEALIVDMMNQHVDGDFCSIYRDQGVQVSDGAVKTWVDTVSFAAPGIFETDIQKKKDNAGEEYLDAAIIYKPSWESNHNRTYGYRQPHQHLIYVYLELDPEEVQISARDRVAACVVEVLNSTATSGISLNSEYQQNQSLYNSRLGMSGMYSQVGSIGNMQDRTGQVINPHTMSGASGGVIAAPRDPMGEIRNGVIGAMLGGQKSPSISADECAALRASMGEDACDPDKGATSAVQEIRNRPGQLLNQGVNMWGNFWNGLFDFAQ